jgi:hypothetical protein
LPLVLLACGNSGEISYETAMAAVEVQTTDQVMQTTNSHVDFEAMDCMRWENDNPVSATRALENLKSLVAQNGFNAIHSVDITKLSTGAALLKNCWAVIRAKGVAYKQ